MKENLNTKVLGICILALFFAFSTISFAIQVPNKTDMRVNDLAGILSSGERMNLENLLKDTEFKTSSQIVLLTVPSLDGESPEEFSLRVVEKWKIGQKEFDNGVLVLVALAERKVRFEVGYGLESILTDAKSSYIISKFITPLFKQKNYFAGLQNGLTAVAGLIKKEFDITPEQLQKFQKEQKKAKGNHIPIGVIIFFVFILFNILKGGTRGGGGGGGRVASAILWGSMMGGSHRGGGGFFSGGGGGGFSGGGGSFGGGGATGGW